MIKTNYQQNKLNKINFNLFSKVSVKFPNLWFGAVRSLVTANRSKKKRNSCSQLLTAIIFDFFFDLFAV